MPDFCGMPRRLLWFVALASAFFVFFITVIELMLSVGGS